MFWIWSFPFNISSTISGFKLDFNFCLFFCFAFRLLFHTINLLLLLFFAYWCVRVCTFHMCHNIFSICKFELQRQIILFYCYALIQVCRCHGCHALIVVKSKTTLQRWISFSVFRWFCNFTTVQHISIQFLYIFVCNNTCSFFFIDGCEVQMKQFASFVRVEFCWGIIFLSTELVSHECRCVWVCLCVWVCVVRCEFESYVELSAPSDFVSSGSKLKQSFK